jgi:hypothetical protein
MMMTANDYINTGIYVHYTINKFATGEEKPRNLAVQWYDFSIHIQPASLLVPALGLLWYHPSPVKGGFGLKIQGK